MSAALVENDPDLALTRAEEAASRKRETARKRNLARRQVVNLEPEMKHHIATHLAEFGADVDCIPKAIRTLLVEALRARGTTPRDMKVAYHQHLAAEAAAEGEE